MSGQRRRRKQLSCQSQCILITCTNIRKTFSNVRKKNIREQEKDRPWVSCELTELEVKLRLLAFAGNFAPVLMCETFMVIAWLTTNDYWLCCETLHQFWCETFTVIAWLTTYDYWLLLRNFAPVLVWNFYGDCLTDNLRLLAFAAKLRTSSGVKLLRWLPDGQLTTTGFCCETSHQFWCETFKSIGDHFFYVLLCYGQSSGSSFLSFTWQKLKTTHRVHIPEL